jgi:asparagine synthase (glutamine-hydrolysing)
MSVKIHLKSPLWQEKHNGVVRQRGTNWNELGGLLEVTNKDAVIDMLQQQNGFYALTWQLDDEFYAAVDHVRSIPLFYALKKEVFYLSDDAEWVRQQVDNTEMDLVAKEEFQLTGYVTGQDTLYPDIKQLQAGEFLVFSEKSGVPKLVTHRYFRFLHTEPDSYDEATLYKQLDNAALASIDNLIRYASGRQIVIPLSGGYDSRLIAVLLKRRGYENIQTFTYGVPGNKESLYSKKVADALGLSWHFVEYSKELWRTAWKTDERWEYQKGASGWCSIAHAQDWLAVKILKKNDVIDHDAVFVPGHSGDFVAGSHIPDIAFDCEGLSLQDTCEATFKRHYSLAPMKLCSTNKKVWIERIQLAKESTDFNSSKLFADCFEKWDWQERQSKFICNSVRVYEFFDYDWWLPLWDMEFVKFWQTVPLDLRKQRKWYIKYVQSAYSIYSPCNETENLNNASEDNSFLRQIKTGISKVVAEPIKNKILSRRRVDQRIKNFVNSPLGVQGKGDEKVWIEYFKQGYIQNGVVVKLFLDEIKERPT